MAERKSPGPVATGERGGSVAPLHSTASPAGLEPLLDNAAVCRLLGIGVRELQRRIASGTFPTADNRRRLKRGEPRPRPRWRPETVRRWMEGGVK